MAINPDDLYIFKFRKDTGKKPEAPAQQAPQQESRAGQAKEASGEEGAKANTAGRLLTKTECKELANGLKCLHHPWRDAYAVCSYCKLGYCYADIEEGKNGYYCIDDIDMETNGAQEYINVPNYIANVAALLFLITGALFVYITYPQIQFIAANIGTNINALIGFGYSYTFSLLNMLFAAICIGTSLVILAQRRRMILAGEIAAFMVIIVLTYEYLITNSINLLGIDVFAFFAVIALAISNTAYYAVSYENMNAKKINWVRPEVF